MIKIAICDDEPFYIQQLIKLINTYPDSIHEKFDITTFSSGYQLTKIIAQAPNFFDLIFLDNLMPEINGIDTAKVIRTYNKFVPIIFVTSTKDFAFDSYAVKASHYLLKPLTEKQTNEILSDFLKNYTKNESEVLTINVNQKIQSIAYRDIIYIESKLRKVIIHTIKDSITFYEKLSNIESELSGGNFYRCHQSFIINNQYIKNIQTGYLLTSQDITIPISKKYQSSIKEQFLDYIRKNCS